MQHIKIVQKHSTAETWKAVLAKITFLVLFARRNFLNHLNFLQGSLLILKNEASLMSVCFIAIR